MSNGQSGQRSATAAHLRELRRQRKHLADAVKALGRVNPDGVDEQFEGMDAELMAYHIEGLARVANQSLQVMDAAIGKAEGK